MKVPTWATVIGVLMILLGGCGALNNVQKIKAPQALDKTSGIMEEMTKEIERSVQEERERKQVADSLNQDSSEIVNRTTDGEPDLKNSWTL